MTELRKDYLLDKYVIISAARGKRPHQFKDDSDKNKESIEAEKKACFFCPGNESMTPDEIYRLSLPEHEDQWKIRVFPNKFAAVSDTHVSGNNETKELDSEIKTHDEFFTFADGFGNHEVVVETNDHQKQLVDLSVEEMVDVFKTYIMRINDLNKKHNRPDKPIKEEKLRKYIIEKTVEDGGGEG